MYINFVAEENKNYYISYWLLLITFLVALMIVVGGLTRLTDSGLSITKWDLISGIVPPITLSEWEHFFNLYKQIPEYKILNSSMTLSEFKKIYWWEYAHRLLGRIIGLAYIIPLIIFNYKNMIPKKLLPSFYLIFFLIAFQGLIGWHMVKSGLVDRVDVSHYLLSFHLTVAFIIFVLLIWNFLIFNNNNKEKNEKKLPYFLPFIFMFLIIFQIFWGAFVSGLDAGQIYQTWPLMGQTYFPDDSVFNDFLNKNFLENPSIVQFIHRNLSYFIFLFFLVILFITYKDRNFFHLRKIVLIVFTFLLLQIVLGILTVLSGAEIIIASLHQIGSIALITSSSILAFRNSKSN